MVQLTIEDAYEKWGPDLVRYAAVLVGPDEAADVVADAFVGLLGRGDGAWTTILDPRPYVFKIVLNSARMRRRGRLRRQHREWRSSCTPVWAELLNDPAVIAAVRTLSVQQRAVTFLTYWEDLSVGDVAALMEVKEGTVKRQLARSRSKLREALQ